MAPGGEPLVHPSSACQRPTRAPRLVARALRQPQACLGEVALTFLDRVEGVVGFYEFDGVGDLLALQDVIVEAQVRHRLLEDLVVLGRVAFKDGTCWEGKKEAPTTIISAKG